MELSNRVVQVRITLKPEEGFPSFSPDDIILLFGDIAKSVGVVLNHNNPSECFVIFPNSETVPDILKLTDMPQWVGNHINLTVDRPRVEITPIIAKLLEDKALKEGEEYEFIPIEVLELWESAQFSPPKKDKVPAAALWADQIKSLQTEEMKQILSAISHEMEARQVPIRNTP